MWNSRQMKDGLPMVGAVVLLLVGHAWLGEACSCVGITVPTVFPKAALVFVGKVVKKEIVVLRSESAPNADRQVEASRITFSVLRRFKGPTQPEYSVLTGECPVFPGEECVNTCEADCEVGKEYLVFAYGADPSTSKCSTIDRSEAASLVREIEDYLRWHKPTS